MSIENSENTENNNPLNTGEAVLNPMGINASFFDNLPSEGNVIKEEKTLTEEEKAEEERLALEKEEADKEEGNNEPPAKEEEPKKGDELKEGEEEEEDTIIHSIANAFEDVELEGEFETGAEGIISATKQIIAHKEKLAESKGVEKLYESLPVVKDVVEHMQRGGSLMSLIQQKQVEDFSKIVLTEDNLDEAERLFRIGLSQKGLEDTLIETLVNASKDEGTLLANGQASHQYLSKAQKEIIDTQIANEVKEKEDDEKEALKIETSIKELISSKKVLHFNLDDATATKLEKFALTDEREKAYAALTTEEWLGLDLQVMEKFKRINAGEEAKPTTKAVKFKVKKATPVGNKLHNGTSVATDSITNLGIKDAKDFFK